MPLTLQQCRALPKVDLHCHLDGAIRPSTILDLAREQRFPLPTEDLAALTRYLQVSPDNRSLPGFLAVFDRFLPLLRTPEALERIAWELCEDKAEDGVRYFEARFAPALCADTPHGMDAIVRGAAKGIERGCRDFGLDAHLLLCIMRTHDAEAGRVTGALARKYHGRGVVGMDLAGNEKASAGPHRDAFETAADAGLGVTIHAGEAGPAANIREAIFDLRATRIGHGVAIGADPELVWYAREQGVTIEMCLTSNLQTGAVGRLAAHPFLKYDREGLRVTLNTDDPAISGITLSSEWALAAQQFGLSIADFERYTAHAVDGAFCPPREKTALKRRIARAFAKAKENGCRPDPAVTKPSRRSRPPRTAR